MESEDSAIYDIIEDDSRHAQPVARANFGFVDYAAEAASALADFLSAHLPHEIEWTANSAEWAFRFTGLTIEIQDGDSDGIVVQAFSDVLPRRRLDPLRGELRRILSESLQQDGWSTFGFGVTLLQLSEESFWHLQEFQKHEPVPNKHKARPQGGWNASLVNDWATIMDNPQGVDLLTANDTAQFLLGKSISEICKNIPDSLRVLHVEPVFRSDLVSRFLHRRKQMEADLRELRQDRLRECVSSAQIKSGEAVNTVEGLATFLCTPHVTFHGAPRPVISSIVRYGFLLPGERIGGTSDKVIMASGASYGIGVYSSPSLEYASMYGRFGHGEFDRFGLTHPANIPGLRIVVCATLMGRPVSVTRDGTRRTTEISDSSAQSHVSPNGLEYIVFDKAQIIPCYVLHMDYGSEMARAHFDRLKNNPALIGKTTRSRLHHTGSYDEDDDFPGARQAKKQALKAAATKWFPYGYGPATGTSFVIEEIGYVSDDEEDYGDFQALRGEQEDEIRSWQQRSDVENNSWFDQYQTVRTTNRDVRGGAL